MILDRFSAHKLCILYYGQKRARKNAQKNENRRTRTHTAVVHRDPRQSVTNQQLIDFACLPFTVDGTPLSGKNNRRPKTPSRTLSHTLVAHTFKQKNCTNKYSTPPSLSLGMYRSSLYRAAGKRMFCFQNPDKTRDKKKTAKTAVGWLVGFNSRLTSARESSHAAKRTPSR